MRGPRGERAIGVGHAQLLVADDDEIGHRVERALEFAARSQHVLEEQDVLDGGRELARDFLEPIEQVDLIAGNCLNPANRERPKSPAPTAERNEDLDECRAAVAHDLGARLPHRRRRRHRRIVGGDSARRGELPSIGRGHEIQHARPPLVQPDCHRVGGEERGGALAKEAEARVRGEGTTRRRA